MRSAACAGRLAAGGKERWSRCGGRRGPSQVEHAEAVPVRGRAAALDWAIVPRRNGRRLTTAPGQEYSLRQRLAPCLQGIAPSRAGVSVGAATSCGSSAGRTATSGAARGAAASSASAPTPALWEKGRRSGRVPASRSFASPLSPIPKRRRATLPSFPPTNITTKTSCPVNCRWSRWCPCRSYRPRFAPPSGDAGGCRWPRC